MIEDDIYGDLHFSSQRPWPIKAFDTAGNVMLCSSFSKSLTPSLRIGFVAAGRYRSAIAAARKPLPAGATNPLTQHVLAEYLESGAYERHLRSLRRSYEKQVESMRAAVGRYFPGGHPDCPTAGWFRALAGIAGGYSIHRACTSRRSPENLAYVPGELFSASGMYRNCLRLNCGNPHTPEIDDAVRRPGTLDGKALIASNCGSGNYGIICLWPEGAVSLN